MTFTFAPSAAPIIRTPDERDPIVSVVQTSDSAHFFASDRDVMAGRPRSRLVDLVEQKRWKSTNKRHRLALLEQDLPADADPELRRAQEAYRKQTRHFHRSMWEARRFE